MCKLEYTGIIDNKKCIEHTMDFPVDGIYEIICELNSDCKIIIISKNCIDTHQIYKNCYYKFHINIIKDLEYKLLIQDISSNYCKYKILLQKTNIDDIFVSKHQWYIKNYKSGIDINILPVKNLCNKVDTILGIIDSFNDKNQKNNLSKLDILDSRNHGEYVSSIITGKYSLEGFHNLLKLEKVHLYPIFYFDDRKGQKKTSEYFIEAINKAKRENIKVLNCSFGGWEYIESEYNAIKNAKDILFVVSAGNNSTNIDVNPRYPACYNLDNIIVVGAINIDGLLYETSNYGQMVDIFAPGEGICGLVCNGETMLKASGTSSAAPFVAALASLLISMNHKLTPKKIKEVIKYSCTEIITDKLNKNIKFVNFEKSINYVCFSKNINF